MCAAGGGRRAGLGQLAETRPDHAAAGVPRPRRSRGREVGKNVANWLWRTMTSIPHFLSRRSRPLWFLASASFATLLVLIGRLDFVGANPLFHAHGYCYLWQADLVAGHVIADSLIALSYVAISGVLWYVVRHGQGPDSLQLGVCRVRHLHRGLRGDPL